MAVKVLAKRGTASEIEGALASIQSAGEIAFATDTKEFYVSDGTQFNKIGKDQLSQFSEISVVTDVNTWTLNQDNSLDLNPPESSPTGITFKPDGTKVFTIGYGRNRVQMYDLSTAWDLTSAGSATESEYLVQNNLSSVQEDFFIDSSGTRMYVLSRSSDSVGQFTLNTAWDISDITFVQDLHINSTSLSGNVTGIVTGESDPCGLTFKPDGTILYLVGYTQDKVHQIPLSTAWDISTHGTITDFNITPANASQAIQFSSDGKEMYIGDYSTESIVHFTLSTAWDVTTATLVSRGVPFLENFGLPTSTGFYFNDVAGKAFVCGRSGDYAYEVVITDAIKFTDPVSAPMLYGDTVHAGNIITSNVGANYFYNALYARSTFISLTTSYLGDSSPTPSIRFGNTVYGGGQVVVHRNLYTNNNGGNVPEFRIMQPRIGGRGIIKIGKEYETTAYLEGGTVDIESEADTFDHLGEFTLGGELKVGGTKPLAYKDPNLYTSGTQIVLDNFNETADTDITSHTPDTGSGYTQVYASNGVTDDDIPFIPANGGYLKAERSNSNDGRRYVNDTTISTNNYEVRAVIKQQVNGDDPFSIVVKYIDEDNYFVMHFAANYSYCYPYSVINGVATQHGALYYYANTSTADNLGLEVAVRVVGNQVSVFYEGQYRGSKEINITGAGKAGFGFGRTSDLYGTSFDLHTNISISKFEVYELPDSLFDGSNSVHYIENGKLGIGTTSPSSALQVVGDGQGDGILVSNVDGYNVGRIYNNNSNAFPVGNLTLSYGNTTTAFINAESNGISIRGGATDTAGNNIKFRLYTSEQMRLTPTGLGIGTTSPSGALHVNQGTGDAVTSLYTSTYGTVTIARNHSTNPYIQTSFVSGQSALSFYQNSNLYTKISVGDSYFNGGNVGIGTTTPGSPLTVAGRVDFQNDLRLRGTDSAANQGVARFYVDSNNKLHIDTANDGSNLFAIDSAGAVKIGSNNHQLTLEQAGGTLVGRLSYTGTILRIQGNGGIRFEDTNGSTIHGIITDSGNYGIGTTSPSEKLHVSGGGNIRVDGSEIYITQASSSRRPVRLHQATYKGAITLQRDGVDNVHISSDLVQQGHTYFNGDSVNVGIGTTSPTEKLHIDGNLKFIGSRFIGTTAGADDLSILPERDLNLGTQASDNVYIGRGTTWGGSVVIQANAANTMVVTDNKVGIGTTSPQAKLDVEGLVIARNNGFQLRATSPSTTTYTSIEQNGTEGVFRLYNGSNWGFIARGVGNTPYIGAYREGSLRIRGFGQSDGDDDATDKNLAIFDFANERVGIGTMSPVALLTLEGAVGGDPMLRLKSTGTATSEDAYMAFNRDNTNNQGYTIGLDSGNNSFKISEDGDSITTNNRLTILTGGNVGINTTNPGSTLEVNGTIRTTSTFQFYNTGGSVYAVGTYDASYYKFLTSGTERMRITSTGNVGIGTTSPTALLHLESAEDSVLRLKSTDNKAFITLQDDDTNTYISAENSKLSLGGNPGVNANNLNFDISNNFVGIGTSSPSEKLEVSGNIKASGTIKGKMEQMFACSFSDDLGTTKHYLSFTSNAEQTNVHADQAAMVMPYNGRVKSIQMRLSNIDADTIRTFGIETIAPGINMYAASNNWTIEETESYELAATDDFYLVNYVFSNTSHFESGDLLAISIQDAEDAYTASRQTYVNVIIEYDLNNGMGNDTATTKYTS